jgi:hypothetical protein
MTSHITPPQPPRFNRLEQLLIEQFEVIEPKARYLLCLLSNPETENTKLVSSVLILLCQTRASHFGIKTIRRLWIVVGNIQGELPIDVLKVLLLSKNPEFRALSLVLNLVKSQKFRILWAVFLSADDNLNSFDILLALPIPTDYC